MSVTTVVVITVLIIIFVLILSILTITKGYAYKHTVDSDEEAIAKYVKNKEHLKEK